MFSVILMFIGTTYLLEYCVNYSTLDNLRFAQCEALMSDMVSNTWKVLIPP